MTIGQLGAAPAGWLVLIIGTIGLGLLLADWLAKAVLAVLAVLAKRRAAPIRLPDEPEISDEQKELAARARKAARLGGYRRRRGF
jgi:hypothetical protein